MWYKFTLPKIKFMYMGVITISPRKKTEDSVSVTESSSIKKTSPAKTKASAAKKTAKSAGKSSTAKTKASSAKTAKARKIIEKSEGSGRVLVIVESPSKAATLSGMLGRGYVVRSSKGHMKDLPKSRLAIDIEHDFAPEYILVKGKATLKNELLKLASESSHVLLASDPDREGEAIAWHLAEILGVDLNEKCRVRFYEITANAVKAAVKNPD